MSISFLLQVVYLLVPTAIANMMPVFVKKIRLLDYPVDFGLKINKKRLFGKNKTFRGMLFGVVGAILIVFLQGFFYRYEVFKNLSLVDFSSINLILFGFLIGFGILVGDLFGSFIKRRLNLRPGKSFYILDQLDSILGFSLFVIPVYFKSWSLFLYAVVVWFVGHLILKYLGHLFGLYKEKI